MAMQRVQMLLEPKQRSKLAELAAIQGKSIAEVTREAINIGIEQIAKDNPQARMNAALEAARQLRESMRQRHGQPLDIDVVEDIRKIREERDEELFCRSGF
jgi:hypothetical protein